ncbi:hypothetical protein K490DRAFT_69376 [Saccharata proteae CBS 121410]|uniref:Uncharacterized protein n=1 Tax=Saccharata proteae CBS 121410 TaxID=1314787 RepID=A0A9P4HNL4_9PEZI|nr:hypothetical protein K490DRAFT_69376 [Saccharata proteae CBS 121410]
MPSAFAFEFDLSALPKLDARGQNFHVWRSVWTLVLKSGDLFKHVSGESLKPPDPGESQDAWDLVDTEARLVLLTSVHSDHTLRITTCDTAAESWKRFANRYDRDTGT